jgi:hypothetical protein
MPQAIAQDRKAKLDLLSRHGYKFNIEMASYVNRETRKVFSYEFVDDNDDVEIERRIKKDPSPESGWTFIFNELPSASLQKKLEAFYTTDRRIER